MMDYNKLITMDEAENKGVIQPKKKGVDFGF